MTARKKTKKVSSQPLSPRFLFLQNGLYSAHGHWLPEVKAWRKATMDAGMEWHCFAHTDLLPDLVQEAGAKPVIPFLPGQVRRGLSPIHRLEAFMDGAERLPAILKKHYPGEPRSSDVLYVGYATDVEMIGVARWLQGLKADRRPKVAFVIHHPSHEWKVNVNDLSIQGDAHRWIYAAEQLSNSSPNIRFFGVIPALSKELSKVMRVPFSTISFNCPTSEEFNPDDIQPSHHVGILGGSRTEQGVAHYPAILRALKSLRPELRVLLQAQPGRQEQALRDIWKKDGTDGMVSMFSNTGTAVDHLRRIASCHLILLPYLPEYYCLRGSGIFWDSSSVGRPVIASAQTSMGRMILAGLSSGLVFPRMDPSGIAETVCDGLSRINNLGRQAMDLRLGWRRRLSTEFLLKELLASFDKS
jgi:glycosyltransferase involved in cell wall biosynthesis